MYIFLIKKPYNEDPNKIILRIFPHQFQFSLKKITKDQTI
jgi:hypothetical protein